MSYRVFFMQEAVETLESCDEHLARRIYRKVNWLAEHFEQLTPERLSGEFKNFYKLRVGDYRVIYNVSREEEKITVHLIGHRKDIYD